MDVQSEVSKVYLLEVKKVEYKRLTKLSDLGTLHAFDFNGKEQPLCELTSLDIDVLVRRLYELENKIESGELGDVKEAEAEANRYEMLYKLQNRDMAIAERRAYDAEHRALVTEKALDKAVELAYEWRTEMDTLSCSSCPVSDDIFPRCKDRGLYEECSKRWKESLIQQAEIEIAGESNVKN